MVEPSDVNEESARELSEQIVRLGSEQRQSELAELARDPSTGQLLGLLADSPRKRAEAYLRTAERWYEARKETNTRRLGEARRALDGLDIELARGLMNRIDGRFLTDEQIEERDALLLEISARTMEMESVEEAGQQLIGEKESKKTPGRRPWWRRRRA